MRNHRGPRTGMIVPIVCCILLAGCGQTDSDPRTLPAPGGSVGAIAAQGGHGANATSNDGSSSQGDSPDGGDQSDDSQGSDSDSAEQDGSGSELTLRKVPDGTLIFTVILKADGIHKSSDSPLHDQEVATLQRNVQGRARMQGIAGNTRAAQPAGPVADLSKIASACGNDIACLQNAVQSRTADEIASAGKRAFDSRQRNTTWSGTSCSTQVKIADKATWSGPTTTGFRTGHATRSGEDSVDCSHDPSVANDDGPRLDAFDAGKTYDLTFPQLRAEATAIFVGGPTDPSKRAVILPQIVIKGVHYDSLDQPLSGSASVKIGTGKGIWNEHWEIPLTEEVHWTFTPDSK